MVKVRLYYTTRADLLTEIGRRSWSSASIEQPYYGGYCNAVVGVSFATRSMKYMFQPASRIIGYWYHDQASDGLAMK